MRRTRGFTLLEVLIAIAIFALLAMATYRMLDSVLQTDRGQREQELRLRELTRAMAAFERDLLQVRLRPVRDTLGDPLPAMTGISSQDTVLEFTRSGWRNPLGQSRSTLQRVRWQREGEHWQRAYWTVLDQAQGSEPRLQQVLDGVTRFELNFLDGEGRWLKDWPPANSDSSEAMLQIPRAVELIIEQRRYGEIRRLWRLPEMPDAEQLLPAAGDADAEIDEDDLQ